MFRAFGAHSIAGASNLRNALRLVAPDRPDNEDRPPQPLGDHMSAPPILDHKDADALKLLDAVVRAVRLALP
jgi:hypothetical protein